MSSRHAGGRPRILRRSVLGKRIEALAHARGLHIDQIAESSGLTIPTIHRIVTGQSDPKISTIAALAKTLRVPVDKLVG